MIKKVLVANRGEIACRIAKTCKKMGITTVGIYSDADKKSMHLKFMDEAVNIGPADSSRSYLNIENIIKAAKEKNVDAIHPGYGFLSENPDFADSCEKNNLIFIGPTKEILSQLGNKTAAKEVADEAGVMTIPSVKVSKENNKSIHEQVNTITDTMRGRIRLDNGTAHLGGINDHLVRIQKADRIYITACGTSWHAGLMGKYLIEEYAGIPVHVEHASEFRYRKPIVNPKTVVIGISQSGETADTLAAIKKAKDYGALTVGICNVVGSSVARETDCGIYTHAGPEIGVASTKAFTSQVAVLFLLSLCFGRKSGLSSAVGQKFAQALMSIGSQVQAILTNVDAILEVARSTVKADNFLYLGRGLNYPVALEGALKLKEISYIHAEGYPAAEMKHGPIALIDEKMPVVCLAPHDNTFDKVLSNIQEVKARKGVIITVTDKRTAELEKVSDYLIDVPSTHPKVFPILASVSLQLLAYHLAVLRGCDIDQPRNLAKSVTVE